MTRAEEVINTHRNGQYQGEGASALRGLRDAEGFLRTLSNINPATTSQVTVGRQWLEQALKDVASLQEHASSLKQEIRLRETKAQEIKMAAAMERGRLRGLAILHNDIADDMNRIPKWVKFLFGVPTRHRNPASSFFIISEDD